MLTDMAVDVRKDLLFMDSPRKLYELFFEPESPLEELLDDDDPLSEEEDDVEEVDELAESPLDDEGDASDLPPLSEAGTLPPELAGNVDPLLA